jgi:hypothetical protein
LPAFTPGNSYPLRTATYTFKQRFSRTRIHFNQETSETTTVDHDCELTGQDRYVAAADDNGVEHRFMDHPRNVGAGIACQGRIREHPEALLWRIFEQPPVFTIADTRPDLVEANRQRLRSFETARPHEPRAAQPSLTCISARDDGTVSVLPDSPPSAGAASSAADSPEQQMVSLAREAEQCLARNEVDKTFQALQKLAKVTSQVNRGAR